MTKPVHETLVTVPGHATASSKLNTASEALYEATWSIQEGTLSFSPGKMGAGLLISVLQQ